jgi:PAS domain S-box-containing protein
MSWVTVIWSISAGACLTLAFLQFIVWLKDRAARANLVFSLGAVAVAFFAGLEVALMRAETPAQFDTVARWIHVPAWVLIVSIVAFVRLYLKAGRRWLAWTVVAVRTLALILNFVLSPNINYRNISALRHVPFLGESVSLPVGVPNPWMLVAQFGLLLLVIFVVDATIAVWRRGNRKQALVVGGSIVLLVVLASAQAVAMTWGIIAMPLMVSLFYLILVGAMAYELSYDLIRSAQLARQLQVSEAILRESEERMSLAMDAANLGLWEWNVGTDELWSTKARLARFGLPTSGKLNLEAGLSTVHIDDRDRVRQALTDAAKTGRDYHLGYRAVLPDGSVRWTDHRGRCVIGADGKPTILRGISMDVTEQKQAEEKFRLAVEASPSGILLVNDRGEIVLVNSQIEKLFGYDRGELIGRFVEILVPERLAGQHPEHRVKFFAAPTARAMGAGRELFGRRKDGSEFPVEIGLNPIETAEGMLVLAAVVDISARVAAEEDARRRREQVEVLSRVSLLGEMTASLAHELNQPLAAIVNNATAAMQYLEQNRLNPEQLQDILTDVIGDGRRACDIMQNVRSAIKKGSAIREPINLNDVVKAVAHMIRADAAAQSCKIKLSLTQDLPTVEGDPTQIQQVLINLVRNAFDANRNAPPSRRVVDIATNYNGDGAIGVAVRDYGSGISETTRERLFEQFFTTKDDGLGMGLAIVRSIIEAHGGSVAAENAHGGGARFHFRLPINNERVSQ